MENVQIGRMSHPACPRARLHLGRFFLIVYINYVPDSLQNFCKIFADDTKIYTAVGKKSDPESLQQDLLKLSEWSRFWLLEFSIQKCKQVQNGNVRYDFEYKLKDKYGRMQVLPKDTMEKDLGIWFQNTLKFEEHINYVVNRANRLVGLIKRTFKSLDRDSFCIMHQMGVLAFHLTNLSLRKGHIWHHLYCSSIYKGEFEGVS